MLTQAILETSGCFGDDTHHQRLGDGDYLEFPDPLPETLVFRRSLPHWATQPNIVGLIDQFREKDYRVIPILIVREPRCTVKSQMVNHPHYSNNEGEGYLLWKASIKLAYEGFAERQLYPLVVHYEAFISSAVVREIAFSQLNLSPPTMNFYDANEKYGLPVMGNEISNGHVATDNSYEARMA
jgi:hypothetical protein